MKRVYLMTAMCLLLMACGVSDSGDFIAIPEDEFPAGIRETRPPTPTTTTITTTIPTTTTTVPGTTPTSLVGPTTTVARTTTSSTTTTTLPTELVQLFYVQGSRVLAVTVTELSPVTVQRKLLDLTERVGMTSPGLRLASVVPTTATLVGSQDRGVVTVELGTSVSTVLPEDQPLFFAQIVLTVLAPSRLGQVVFTQNGSPYPAVKSDSTVLDPGEPAAWEDYEDLIADEPDIPVRTTSTTSTTLVA